MGAKTIEVKGTSIRGTLKWVKDQYGAEAHERLIGALPPEIRERARSALPSSWYPIETSARIFDQMPIIAEAKSRDAVEQLFKKASGDVAREHLSTLYKMLLVLMTPDRMFEMIPRVWGTYYRGIEVRMAKASRPHAGTMEVRGLRALPYMGPIAAGWLEFAYDRVGGRLRMHEESWQRGVDHADPLVFHMDWS